MAEITTERAVATLRARYELRGLSKRTAMRRAERDVRRASNPAALLSRRARQRTVAEREERAQIVQLRLAGHTWAEARRLARTQMAAVATAPEPSILFSAVQLTLCAPTPDYLPGVERLWSDFESHFISRLPLSFSSRQIEVGRCDWPSPGLAAAVYRPGRNVACIEFSEAFFNDKRNDLERLLILLHECLHIHFQAGPLRENLSAVLDAQRHPEIEGLWDEKVATTPFRVRRRTLALEALKLVQEVAIDKYIHAKHSDCWSQYFSFRCRDYYLREETPLDESLEPYGLLLRIVATNLALRLSGDEMVSEKLELRRHEYLARLRRLCDEPRSQHLLGLGNEILEVQAQSRAIDPNSYDRIFGEIVRVPLPLTNWTQYAQLAVQYYVSFRFAALSGYMPVSGNLMHHAIELLLKCGVLKGGGVPTGKDVDTYFRQEFSHRLADLWPAFKALHPEEDLTLFDVRVQKLDEWEELRYPSQSKGFAATIEMGKTPDGSGRTLKGVPVAATYVLGVEDCDELMKRLWTVVSLSREFFYTSVGRAESTYSQYNQHAI